MNEILKKFDEAKAIALQIISALNQRVIALDEREKAIVLAEDENRKKRAELAKKEKAISAADKLLLSQAELDKANNELKDKLASLEKQQKELRESYVKKFNELTRKEEELNLKEKELREGFARLKQQQETYKEKILEEMTKRLKGA